MALPVTGGWTKHLSLHRQAIRFGGFRRALQFQLLNRVIDTLWAKRSTIDMKGTHW